MIPRGSVHDLDPSDRRPLVLTAYFDDSGGTSTADHLVEYANLVRPGSE